MCGAAVLAITYVLVAGAPFAPPDNYSPPARSGNIPSGVAAERHLVLHTLLIRSGVALAVMLIVSAALGWIVAGRVLRPLRVITERTREITESNLHERLALEGPKDEITDLSDTIDGLLGRLDRAFEAQRRFVANVSHELRTPLAMMRTSLDVAAAKPQPLSTDARVLSEKLGEGLDQADRLVESFLALARAQASPSPEAEPVSLGSMVGAAAGREAERIARRGLDLRLRLDGAEVTGNRVLLERLVANLVENAVSYSPAGGEIEISTSVQAGAAVLTVTNGGQVIDPAVAGRLHEPFERARARRTGSDDGVGMGLAIVAAICQVHGGRLEIAPGVAGGLIVTVRLPLTSAGGAR